ncbi:MAG: 2-isopropylmalate synthase [Ruminococcus sp.]|nr:2-isopropylmalate synthase [Ruminococcus sp.]
MKHADKYKRGYYMPPYECLDWAKKEYIDHAPSWCSVDLRDGNQALIIPMSLDEKLEFYKKLLEIGFKEIEIGFPAASETEYEFCRTLIEKNMIPKDVRIQVLTQSREHIIKKTFEAIKGCDNAIVHLYNSTSVAQREQVFRKSKEEIIEIAVSGAKLCKQYREEFGENNIIFEYSPESFTGTEPEFALEIVNAVLDVWQPTKEKPVIINLPVTVEMSLPHVYASQIEYMCKNMKYRENVIVSLHPHNDRGCGVADSELGLLAGADRIEGTCFGNGERTGNVDIVTLALNMYTHGVDPQLDFSDMPSLVEVYERVTRMKVNMRSPYAGSLVFAAFSGSHQDAIAKGMKWREEKDPAHWTVPYLPLDPKDVGREYDGDVIRINSQSGKGGIGFLLQKQYGYTLPKKMAEDFGYAVKSVSDHKHAELQPAEIYDIFKARYLNKKQPCEVTEAHYVQNKDDTITAKVTATLSETGKTVYRESDGNGRLNAVANALKDALGIDFVLETYEEHALERHSNSEAVSYISIVRDGKTYWGAGRHSDIIVSGVRALVSAINNSYNTEY